jgi:hypothetical protein
MASEPTAIGATVSSQNATGDNHPFATAVLAQSRIPYHMSLNTHLISMDFNPSTPNVLKRRNITQFLVHICRSVLNASWLTCPLISNWRNPEEPSTLRIQVLSRERIPLCGGQ